MAIAQGDHCFDVELLNIEVSHKRTVGCFVTQVDAALPGDWTTLFQDELPLI